MIDYTTSDIQRFKPPFSSRITIIFPANPNTV